MQRELGALFNKVGQEVAKQLGAGGVSPEMMTRSFTDYNNKMAEMIFEQAKAEAMLTAMAEIQLKEHIFTASKVTMERLRGNVMDSIRVGQSEGLGIDAIARSIRGDFVGMRDFETVRIARTEMQQAHNSAKFNKFKEENIDYQQWITSMDGSERESHGEINSEIVRVGEPFSNGLLFPGDRSGDIEEWIHCRCQLVPFIMPPDMMAPLGAKWFYEGDIVKVFR